MEKLKTAIANLYDMAESGDTEAKSRIAQRKEELNQLGAELHTINAEIADKGNAPAMIQRIVDLLKLKDGKSIEAMNNYFPAIRATLQNNEVRKELSVMLPSVIEKLVVNLEANQYYVVRKDGSRTPTTDVKKAIEKIKAKGFNF